MQQAEGFSQERRHGSWTTLVLAGVLLALNAFVCHELFFTEYTNRLASIEGAYIAISRYFLENPFDFSWFRLWYCGIPYQNTYPPLLHILVAGVAWLLGTSTAWAYHIVTAISYSLGPVTLFLLGYHLSRDRWASFSAAIIYSLLSPSALLLEVVRNDLESPWGPRRLHTLVNYGDGPHVAALTLLPLALLALHRALESRHPRRVYAACLACAAVVLTNWLGGFALALAALSYLVARSQEERPLKAFLPATGIGLLAYAIASPWIPPSTVADVRRNSQIIEGRYPVGPEHIVYGFVLLAATLLLRLLLKRWNAGLLLRAGCYLLLFTGSLTFADVLFDIQLVPQPHRYHLELEMAAALVVAFSVAPLTRRLPLAYKASLAAAALLAIAVQLHHYRQFARDLVQPTDIERSVEYKVARWLADNLPRQRIFAAGSVQFWLNAFGDNPQVGGGFGQGVVNEQIPIVHFGLPWTENDGETSAMWLRLYGAQAVIVSGPQGRDAYREVWRDGNKFEGVLPELWRDGDDAVFGVPARSPSLAHVILLEQAARRSPVNNLDIDPVLPLALAIEDPSLPAATFDWEGPDHAQIAASLQPNHLLFVQITYHPGWQAFVDGEERLIRRDPLGLMLIEPKCSGPCEVTLLYDGGLEARVARWTCGAALAGGILWWVLVWRKRRAAREPA